MKDVGHVMAALLIQVETGQLIFAFRSVLSSERVLWRLCVISYTVLGERRGKAAVLEVCRQILENVRVHRFNRESIVLGEDTQASPPFSTRSADWCATSTKGYRPRATLPGRCSAIARRSVSRSTANGGCAVAGRTRNGCQTQHRLPMRHKQSSRHWLPISLRPPVGSQHCLCYANPSLLGR
jgi:hypothetical protein